MKTFHMQAVTYFNDTHHFFESLSIFIQTSYNFSHPYINSIDYIHKRYCLDRKSEGLNMINRKKREQSCTASEKIAH